MEKNLIYVPNETFANFESRKRAHFVNSLSGVKSANLIGTISGDSQTNLSIVSSAFHLGASPALMGIIIRPDVSPRHTLDNIREEKFFTLNHVNEDIYQKAHQTSARYPREVSEFDACGLTEEYLEEFKAPFVKESNIKLSMELVREVPIIENGTHMLISKILGAWIPDSALESDGHISILDAGSVCVTGLDSYHSISKLERLPYAKP
ncbi:flavin reductase family protein [Halobacteriovorax sp.]|uniref:flavin reductase family protein n=1 Tax=Halobacteriovorax sp. TaxID=2020862 RepID=UPI00356AF869